MTPRDPLDDLLDRWQPSSKQLPDLRAEIRREIARSRTHEPETLAQKIEQVFSRPSFAFAFVAACVLLGLFLAEARVSRQHALYGAQIARSYVQLIDPLMNADAAKGGKAP